MLACNQRNETARLGPALIQPDDFTVSQDDGWIMPVIYAESWASTARISACTVFRPR